MVKKVVIVGKPNVGKSQLFNRLIGERHSVVLSEPGITRDRITKRVTWFGKSFFLIDTGGYTDDDLFFQSDINFQVKEGLKEADLIIFLVSCKEKIDNDDLYLSKLIKKYSSKKVILAANKCDIKSDESEHLEEYKLGFGEAIYISAEHGINTGKLLNCVVENLEISDETIEDSRFKFSVIGKPNVGKSTLVNSIFKQDRIIISDVPGTTRDAIDLDFEFQGKRYSIIDTPGIRKHASIQHDDKEKYSILRSKKAIQRSNLILFVLDISKDISELDERIGGLIYEANIPTIIVANKWDLILDKSSKSRIDIELNIRKKMKFLHWAPIVFISAKNSRKVNFIFNKMEQIRKEASKKIKFYLLNDFLNKLIFLFSIPKVSGKRIQLFSMSQIESQIPTFLILCNDADLLHFSYSRLIENQIRKNFDYKNTPITVIFKKK